MIKKPVLIAGVLVAAALIACGVAWGQTFGKNKVQYSTFDWRVASSENFDVYFYSGGDSLASVVLELAEEAAVKLTADLGHKLQKKVPIIIYESHYDFEQTNVITELLEEGVGGFTEIFKNRVVVPFTGSYEDLRHVVVHELVHAFMFDMMYGGVFDSILSAQYLFQIPSWFSEGLPEYESLGWDSNTEMITRDAAVSGYAVSLERLGGGYLVYKLGQSAVRFMVERHGHEKLREILGHLKRSKNVDNAFERSLGMSLEKFSEAWMEHIRKQYWPEVGGREDPERFGRRITDHKKDRSYLNLNPSVSPRGDRVAYFSDREGYMDLMLASAIDGKVLKRLIRGEKSMQFEVIPSFRSAVTWSPDEKMVAFVAKSGKGDVVYLLNVEKARVVKEFRLDLKAISFPSWSPDGKRIALTGLREGMSDLYVLDLDTGVLKRLMNDRYDDIEPSWSRDGRVIAFSSDRERPFSLGVEREPGGIGDYAIYAIDPESLELRRVIRTGGNDRNPAWSPDGKSIIFTSSPDGTSNLFVFGLEDSSLVQLTNILGGVSAPDWSESDRLAFTVFSDAGWDVYVAKEPLGLKAVMDELKSEGRVWPLVEAQDSTAGQEWRRVAVPSPGEDVGRPWTGRDTLEYRLAIPVMRLPWDSLASIAVETQPADSLSEAAASEAWTDSVLVAKSLAAEEDSLRVTEALGASGDSLFLRESTLKETWSGVSAVANARRYKIRFSPDWVTGGFQYSSSYGFGGSTQISLSDFLGNHRIYIASDFFSSLQETDILAIYYYLPRRLDLGVGAFHYKSYYYSRTTALGEEFSEEKYFSDRNYGFLLLASYPFGKFRRVDVDLTHLSVDRIFYEYDPDVLAFRSVSAGTKRMFSPGITFVGDTVQWGMFGPVSGSRWAVSYSTALKVSDESMSFQTAWADLRKYIRVAPGYSFAFRLVGAASEGRDAQRFFAGGAYTLRGYEDFEFTGTRVVFLNSEFRFPFIERLGLVWPIPIGFSNIGGVLFLDVGTAWTDDDTFRPFSRSGGFRMSERYGGASFGTGIRTGLYFVILKVDFAWRTDFDEVSGYRTHFSIGGEF